MRKSLLQAGQHTNSRQRVTTERCCGKAMANKPLVDCQDTMAERKHHDE
jgi:hypothetical protein